MQLTSDGFARARSFLLERARPLEAALFRHAFERGRAAEVTEALSAFGNDDGGFGHGLEPDLRLPASSVLATTHGLRLLRAAGAAPDHPLVAGALAFLREHYDPALGAWRSVPREAEDFPHAGHWKWRLHESGKSWPVGVLPRAEILAHLHHYAAGVDAAFLAEVTARFQDELARAGHEVGADGLLALDALARTPAAPTALRAATAARAREIGVAIVSRDPEQWTQYVPKPLRIAPAPEAVLADSLADEVARSLDWEISQQAADGSWRPNWSWNGAYPEAWEQARREWQGELTLGMLEALRAWGRLETA